MFRRNICRPLPERQEQEAFETILHSPTVRIERIVSHGHASPADFWYDQEEAEWVLLVQGSGFNWPQPDHFRLVFLSHDYDLRDAIARIARFLEFYRKRHGHAY